MWLSMRNRCNNRNYKQYKDYGGRGIKVCERWSNFENFLEDMGERPKGFQIDRVDNGGDYEPSNCRWATRNTQCSNRRDNHLITYKGKTQNLTQWSKEIGVDRETLFHRVKRGYTPQQTIEHRRYAILEKYKKYTDADICRVFELFNSGMQRKDIVRELGMSQSVEYETISQNTNSF